MQVRSLRSYCKINLFLDVGRKINKLKLHDIRSLIFLINIFDEIYVKKNKLSKDVVKFKGPFSSHVNNYDNSIKKSLSLLKEKGFIKQNQNYNVSIKKNIPVFSGLGGGSSNASSIIKYFLKGKKLSYKNLNYFTKVLGSDLRVFFKSSRILQQSLFNIKNLKKNYKYYFILVYPHLRCSTKEIYSRLKVFKGINRKNLYEPKSNRRKRYGDCRFHEQSAHVRPVRRSVLQYVHSLFVIRRSRRSYRHHPRFRCRTVLRSLASRRDRTGDNARV